MTRPDLTYTPAIEAATASLYDKLADVMPVLDWPSVAPYIYHINRLKKERGAVILAHNYMTPDIFHGIADYVGDSLGLAQQAAKTDADIIVQCGVHFMAETSKILNPHKTVLIPDMAAGCSLASGITAEDVLLLKQKYPGVPVVTYVNTSAEVKAVSDICCTSGNALDVVESLDSDTVLCIPDQYLAQWIAGQTSKKILTWQGSCEVHERFTGEQLRAYRTKYNGDITIIAHPECPQDVLAEADFVGSTSGMIDYAKTNRPKRVLMVTECSMSDNVAAEVKDVEFIRPCNLCPHMKRITLPKILDALLTLSPAVEITPELAAKARLPIDRMLAVSPVKSSKVTKLAS
jgi:quinolinate synthase